MGANTDWLKKENLDLAKSYYKLVKKVLLPQSERELEVWSDNPIEVKRIKRDIAYYNAKISQFEEAYPNEY